MNVPDPGAVVPTLDESKLKRLAEWRAVNGPGFSLAGLLYAEADLETAIAFVRLFWPDTVEHRGGVFLRDRFSEERFDEWRTACNGNIEDVQYSMNQTVLGDTLPGREYMVDENLAYLAASIVEMWRCRLAALHPGREFKVTYFETNLDLAVTFAAKSLPEKAGLQGPAGHSSK